MDCVGHTINKLITETSTNNLHKNKIPFGLVDLLKHLHKGIKWKNLVSFAVRFR